MGLGEASLTNENQNLADIIEQKSLEIFDKTNTENLISYLQTYYFSFAESNDTAFCLWLFWYFVSKRKLPEMMAFAYPKLITEKEMLARVKQIILKISKK